MFVMKPIKLKRVNDVFYRFEDQVSIVIGIIEF